MLVGAVILKKKKIQKKLAKRNCYKSWSGVSWCTRAIVCQSTLRYLLTLHSLLLFSACVSFWFFFSSRRRHTRLSCDWSSDVCSSDLSFFSSRRRHTRLSCDWSSDVCS